MTLLAQIRALPDSAALITARDEAVIANLLSVGKTKLVRMEIGIGTVLSTLGTAGGPFLDGMVTMGASDSNVKWAMRLLETGEFNIGSAAAQAQMGAIATAVPSLAAPIALLLALAVVPDPVSAHAVAVALEGV